MDISQYFMPFTVIFDWLRTFELTLFGFTFTFMDMFVWEMIASVVIWFICRLMNDE